MKIRMGFITNSSSTNFLIISKEELTEEYLFKKLGFVQGGVLEEQGRQLCSSIMDAINGGLRYYDYDTPTYESIKEVFGDKSAMIFERKENCIVEMKVPQAWVGKTLSQLDLRKL